MMDRLGRNYRYRTNCTLNIEGKHLDKKFDMLKPDITAYDKNSIIIVEFSCPYANVNSEGNTLDKVFADKAKKYTELAEVCSKVYKKKVHIYTIIVSSLGAVHEKSIGDIRKLLKIGPSEKRLMDTILRRLSLTSCIGSYFVFNKLAFKEYKVDCKDNTCEGDIQEGIDNDSIEQAEDEEVNDNMESTKEDITIGSCNEETEDEDIGISSDEEDASTSSIDTMSLHPEDGTVHTHEGTQLHTDNNDAYIFSDEDDIVSIENN